MNLRKIDTLIATKKGHDVKQAEDDLIAFLANRVWVAKDDYYYKDRLGCLYAVPCYTTDGNSMVELMNDIVARVKDDGQSYLIRGKLILGEQWVACVVKYDDTTIDWYNEVEAKADTPQLAVAMLWCELHGVDIEEVCDGV